MSETRFTPVRGTEEAILDMPYNEGYLYFAVDTKKIFLDSNRQSKIPMGGGGGAAAGSGVIIGSRQISIEEERGKDLMKYPDSIDRILRFELTNLINMVKQKEIAFKPGEVEKYCNLYNKIKGKNH